MSNEVLVKVENVSKKFCRDLKKSLWYGVKDIGSELVGRNNHQADLRPKEFWALQDISFELKRGEVLGLIGPNGAGKTTLLKILNGIIKPDTGRVTMHGRVGALIALGAGFNPILTGRENIYVNGAVLGLSKKEIDAKFDEIVDFAELWDFIDTPVQSYSSGMQVRLGFAVAAQMDPNILLTDEVLAVGDFAFRNKCYSTLQKLKVSGVSTILVSHNMVHILQFTNRVVWIENGRIKKDGNPLEVCGLYLSSYQSKSSKRSNTDQDTGLYGEILTDSGIVNNVKVSLTDSSGKTTNNLGAFDPFSIQFSFDVKRDSLLGLTFKIHKDDGQVITIFNNLLDGKNITPENGIVKGKLKINSLNVIPGEYVIVLVIHSGTEFLYRNIVENFSISLEGQENDLLRSNYASGIVRLQHEWS